eukprot:TRINITY_DN5698_c0_g1_i17.p1 TRINITY_DN5698_c0_g1~~TRINITY_DN5698_c0_g1_i17.p1  ORF type:complete len:107 (-),score=4.28 TRINITY_DN5698_c0_g1_i17:71-391(-)
MSSQPSENGTVKRGSKRKQVRKACAACAAAHVACSETRPCYRCVKRGIQCVDRERKKRRKGDGEDGMQTYSESDLPYSALIPLLFLIILEKTGRQKFSPLCSRILA